MKLRNVCKTVAPLLLVFTLLVSSCSGAAVIQITDSQTAYRNAVEDARIAEPGEISRDLVAIVGYNRDLVWEGVPGSSRVLVVTWTSWDGYNGSIGESITASRDIWVTVAPDIKDFTSKNRLSGDKLVLRLEQLLGVPAGSGKSWFVEFWVDPDDIFRPSPDPDITDHEAELDFPRRVSPEHIEWINALKAQSYGENGYPWTRLGYTYDWGNPKSEIGLSEFVIRKDAAVQVRSVASN